jgi:hypothetical protein
MKTVAHNRDDFKHSCFRVGTRVNEGFFKLMFAMQSPMLVVFATVRPVDVYVGGIADINDLDAACHDWRLKFSTDWRSFTLLEDLYDVPLSDISIVSNVQYIGGDLLATTEMWESLDVVLAVYTALLPTRVGPKPEKPAAEWHDTPKHATPWLRGEKHATTSGPTGATGSTDHVNDSLLMTDDAIDELFDELRELQVETEAGQPALPDFHVKVLGGKWTIEHMGIGHDAFKAKAVRIKSEAAKFAYDYGMGKDGARYNVSIYGGDAGALEVAKTWASKAQFFYDVWKAKADASYAFTAADCAPWRPSDAFLALLPTLGAAAHLRACQLRDFVPRKIR